MLADLALILGVVALVVAGQTLLKVGMDTVGPVGLVRLRKPGPLIARILRSPTVLAGVCLYALSALGWIVVLSRADLSFAYPFLALSYLAVPLVGVVMLHEPLTRTQGAGLALVVCGVMLVAATYTAA